jgi:hypothetical protein
VNLRCTVPHHVLVAADAGDVAMELRTYACAECGHSQTYTVDSGNS